MGVLRSFTVAAALVLCLSSFAHFVRAVTPAGVEYAKGRVLVQLNGPEVHKGDLVYGGVVETYMPQIHVAVLAYPDNVDIFNVIPLVKQQPNVVFAEPDYIVHATFTPNDSYWSQQWGPQAINCQAAWDIHTGDAGTVIGIVDTGCDYNHPDLAAKFVGGYDFVNGDSDPMDDHGHGTHCSGISAASTNNGVGIAGVSYNCKVMACKVLDSGGSGSFSNCAQGVIYATDHGAKVVSMSFGAGSGDSTMEAACNYAWSNGVVVCAAAGNNGSSSQFFPAAYTACIAVASSDPPTGANKSSFSNYGADWVDVAAPGNGILSTLPGNSYASWSGTSMATPHVSGAAALIYSKIGARSAINAVEVRYLIENNCDIGTWGSYVAHGHINVGRAIAAISGPPTETTYFAGSVSPVLGTVYGGNAQSLAATDGDKYRLNSGIAATYRTGSLTQYVYGATFYAEYDVGTGMKLGGNADMVADSYNPASCSVYIVNWSRSRWEAISTGLTVGPSGLTTTIPLPSGLTNYISSTHKIRIKIQANCNLPILLSADLLKLRLLGY